MKYFNGFASDNFLNFASSSYEHLYFSTQSQEVFPLLITSTNNSIFNSNSKVCFTPIGFSGPTELEVQKDLFTLITENSDLAAGFLQTRQVLPKAESFVGLREFDWGTALLETRTNYRLPLSADSPSLIANMKRDTRARIKKIVLEDSKFELSVVTEVEELGAFAAMYSETAQRAGFSEPYCFSNNSWQMLLSDPKWQICVLKYQGIIVAGCAVCEVSDGFDYTYMGYRRDKLDFSRAMIWYLLQHLSNNNAGYLYLGGGIEEGDSLAKFKLSFGAETVQCMRVKFAVFDNLKEPLKLSELKTLMSIRWPQ